MSRTVLTYPDLPTVLTPSVAASTYLPLAGGTLTGDLVLSEATPSLGLKLTADTQPRSRLTDTALSFGPGGSTAPDTTLSRTGAGALRADTHLGVGVNPMSNWSSGHRSLQVGGGGSLFANDGVGNPQVVLNSNSYYPGGPSVYPLVGTWPASKVVLYNGGVTVDTAPAVAVGSPQTFTTRMALAPTGTLTLTPDAGQAALAGSAWSLATHPGAASALRVSATGYVYIASGGNGLLPDNNNTTYLGYTGNAWHSVWSATGTIQTSSAQYKEGITPLDPALCYQAAKDVRWYEFAYLPPAYTAPEPPPDIAYDAADDNETKAEKKALRDEAEARAKAAHLKMVAETAPARHQRGFVFPTGEARDEAGGTLPPVPALFGLSDRESTTPQADLATLGAALQELIRRFEVVEAKVNV